MTERFPLANQNTSLTSDMLALRADVRVWEKRVMANEDLLAFLTKEPTATTSPLEAERNLLLARQALQAALWRGYEHYATHRAEYIEAARQECPVPLTFS